VNEAEALFLGMVQGLTEFLPVSSSGHLVMFQALLGIHEEGLLFEITVHVATLLSVLVFYRRRVAELVVGVLTGRAEALRYVAKLVVATLPAVIVALAFGDFLDAQFESPRVSGICLLITGGILWTTRSTLPAAHAPEPSWAAALVIGCAQAFAILPGISRSGSTVAAALAMGVAPVAAAEFSFLMGVAAIAAAAARSVPDLAGVPSEMVLPLALGGVAAAISGLAAIWLFIRLLRNQGFHNFAYYTWAAGAGFLAWLAMT